MLSTLLEPIFWLVFLLALLMYHYLWDLLLQSQAYFAGRGAQKTREKELYRGGVI